MNHPWLKICTDVTGRAHNVQKAGCAFLLIQIVHYVLIMEIRIEPEKGILFMYKGNRIGFAIFLTPSILLFVLIFAAPIATVIGSSFTDWRMNRPPSFIGVSNYIELFTNDRSFSAALFNTMKWIVLQSTINVGMGLLVALLTANKKPFLRFVKVAYLVPSVISSSALAMIFFFVFHPTLGLVNNIIRLLWNPEFNQNWYFQSNTAFMAVTLTTIFFAGTFCLLFSAQIASIPEAIFESVRIDGASGLATIFYITLPMIRHIIGTCMILAAAGAIKTFEVIYLTTGGGPGTKTINLSVYLYNIQMRSDRYGYGNAVGTIMIILGVAVIALINRIFRNRDQY